MKVWAIHIIAPGRDEKLKQHVASWDVIMTLPLPEELSMTRFLFDKEEAEKLMTYLTRTYPPEQRQGWVSIAMTRHTRRPPYPAMEITEYRELRRDS